MLKIECYTVGILKTNCYLIEDLDTGNLAIIDPGSTSKDLSEKVNEYKDRIKYIILTHGHFDHIKAVGEYKKLTKAQIVACKCEKDVILDPKLNLSARYVRKGLDDFEVDIWLNDLDTIMLGKTEIKLIYTPGHTQGSCCYIADKNIFSGDTLFKEEIGRTDLATGNYENILKSLKKLYNLRGEYKVYPGHGEETTLEFERKNNKYFQDQV